MLVMSSHETVHEITYLWSRRLSLLQGRTRFPFIPAISQHLWILMQISITQIRELVGGYYLRPLDCEIPQEISTPSGFKT